VDVSTKEEEEEWCPNNTRGDSSTIYHKRKEVCKKLTAILA
jgi:hypothetical protein